MRWALIDLITSPASLVVLPVTVTTALVGKSILLRNRAKLGSVFQRNHVFQEQNQEFLFIET